MEYLLTKETVSKSIAEYFIMNIHILGIEILNSITGLLAAFVIVCGIFIAGLPNNTDR